MKGTVKYYFTSMSHLNSSKPLIKLWRKQYDVCFIVTEHNGKLLNLTHIYIDAQSPITLHGLCWNVINFYVLKKYSRQGLDLCVFVYYTVKCKHSFNLVSEPTTSMLFRSLCPS